MAKKDNPKLEEDREERITMEVIVDCCDEYERASGWYYYLQDQITFPFTATCIVKRASSPLKVKDEIEVIDLASDDDCEREIFVTVRWEKDGLAVPLAQLMPHPDTGGDDTGGRRLAVLGADGLRILKGVTGGPIRRQGANQRIAKRRGEGRGVRSRGGCRSPERRASLR